MVIAQVILLGILRGFVYALMATGLSLIAGVLGVVNLAHGAVLVLSAYFAYFLFQAFAVDPFVAIFIVAPLGFALGMAVYYGVFMRLIGHPRFQQITVLVTFGAALIVEGLLSYLFTGVYRSVPTSYSADAVIVGELFLPTGELYASAFSLVALSLMATLLRHSRLGVAIRAVRENRVAAAVVGVNVDRVSAKAFGLAFLLTATAGVLLSYLFSFYPGGHWQWVSILLALVAVGGMGSMMGALLGALLLSVASSLVGHFVGATWAFLVFYSALFLILIFKPQGLLGLSVERART